MAIRTWFMLEKNQSSKIIIRNNYSFEVKYFHNFRLFQFNYP